MKKIFVLLITLSFVLIPIKTLAEENDFNPIYYSIEDEEELDDDYIETYDNEYTDEEDFPITAFSPEVSSLDEEPKEEVVPEEDDNSIKVTSVEAVILIAGILAFGIVIGSIIMFVILKKTNNKKKK
jgi:hypothetical protein